MDVLIEDFNDASMHFADVLTTHAMRLYPFFDSRTRVPSHWDQDWALLAYFNWLETSTLPDSVSEMVRDIESRGIDLPHA